MGSETHSVSESDSWFLRQSQLFLPSAAVSCPWKKEKKNNITITFHSKNITHEWMFWIYKCQMAEFSGKSSSVSAQWSFNAIDSRRWFFPGSKARDTQCGFWDEARLATPPIGRFKIKIFDRLVQWKVSKQQSLWLAAANRDVGQMRRSHHRMHLHAILVTFRSNYHVEYLSFGKITFLLKCHWYFLAPSFNDLPLLYYVCLAYTILSRLKITAGLTNDVCAWRRMNARRLDFLSYRSLLVASHNVSLVTIPFDISLIFGQLTSVSWIHLKRKFFQNYLLTQNFFTDNRLRSLWKRCIRRHVARVIIFPSVIRDFRINFWISWVQAARELKY